MDIHAPGGGALAAPVERVDQAEEVVQLGALRRVDHEIVPDLRQKAEAAGRGLDTLSVSVFAFQPPRPDALARLRDLGVERVIMVAPRRLADALPFLDRMASLNR